MNSQFGRALDEIDVGILKILQEDCRISLEQIAEKLGAPKSTIHYRIKRLEEEGVIEGYYAKVNLEKLGKNYLTVTFVRAKYGPGYHEKVGQRLSEIPGVWGIYFIFGENDFVILTRSKDREDYMQKLEKIMDMPEIERTNTQIVAKVIKEDVRGGLDI
jgi:DNA-binding Lrp family transcriptional regulator